MEPREKHIQPVIETLSEASVAAEHLGVHLRLLMEALGGFDSKLDTDVRRLGPLIQRVCMKPTVDYCARRFLPWQPILDACNGLRIPVDATRLSIAELAAVAERALEWCNAIRESLGDPIEPPRPTTS